MKVLYNFNPFFLFFIFQFIWFDSLLPFMLLLLNLSYCTFFVVIWWILTRQPHPSGDSSTVNSVLDSLSLGRYPRSLLSRKVCLSCRNRSPFVRILTVSITSFRQHRSRVPAPDPRISTSVSPPDSGETAPGHSFPSLELQLSVSFPSVGNL